MTTPKYSINAWFSSFKNALPSGILPALISLASLAFLFPVSTFSHLQYMQTNTSPDDGTVTPLKEIYKYIIQTEASLSNVATIAVIIASVLMGIFMLRFFVSKKQLNVFYSLGMKRTNLFLSRFFAGALLLVLSIVIPFAMIYFVNGSMLGFNSFLLTAVLYQTTGFCVVSLVAYAISAAVFMLVGTVLEGAVFSFGTLGAVTLIATAVQNIAQSTLWGNPYILSTNTYRSITPFKGVSLIDEIARFNPILLFGNLGNKYNSCGADGKLRIAGGGSMEWVNPNYLPLFIWLIVAVAFTGLAVYLFNKRKAEIAGFIGKSRLMNNFSIAVVGLFGASIIISNFGGLSYVMKVALSLVMYAVLYMVVQAFFLRDKKKFVHNLKILPIHLIAVVALFAALGTGFFGYETRKPDIEKIERIEITNVVYDPVSGQANRSFGGVTSSADIFPSFMPIPLTTLDGFTSVEDFEAITKLHQSLIGAEKYADYGKSPTGTAAFTYHLKNGKTMTRFYPINNEEITQSLLSISETKGYKDRVEKFLMKEYKTPKDWILEEWTSTETGNQTSEMFQYGVGQLTMISPEFTQATDINSLTKEQFDGIKKAMVEDYKKQTAKQKYMPEENAVGFFYYTVDPILSTLMFSKYHTNKLDDNLTWEAFFEKDKVNRPEKIDIPSGILATSGWKSGDPSQQVESTIIPITKDMTNTLKALESANLMQYFKAEPKKVRSVIQNLDPNGYKNARYEVQIPQRFFISDIAEMDYITDMEKPYDPGNSPYSRGGEDLNLYPIFKGEQAAEIAKLGRTHGYRQKDDIVVIVYYEDASGHSLYIPKDKAPSYMKSNKTPDDVVKW